MKHALVILLSGASAVLAGASESAPAYPISPPSEEAFYRIETIPGPTGAVLEVSGLCRMPDGTLASWFFPTDKYEKPPYSGWEIPPPSFHRPSDNTAWRGWCFQLTSDGEFIPFANGLRSPNGLGFSPEDELFVSDNQGEYLGACVLHHVTPGAFHGHPNGLFWGPDATVDPFSVPLEELDRRRKLPAVVFPFILMGQSLAQPLWDETGGQFGPFAGQMFIGDQTHSTVMRVVLEKVKGEYQGA